MDMEWNPLTDFFSAGLPHPSDSHALSSSYSTFSVDRSAFESQDQPGTAALNLELEHPQDGIPNKLNYFGIWHPSAKIQSPANLDPCLVLRREEEEEEEELLPEGGGSVNIAIMKMSVDSHSNQPSTIPAAASTKRKRRASLDILPLNRPMSTWPWRQPKGKAKELPKASTLAMSGALEWMGDHFFSCFDYYNSTASFDSEAPQLLDTLEDLQKADPETRLIQVTCKQTITLSPAGHALKVLMRSLHICIPNIQIPGMNDKNMPMAVRESCMMRYSDWLALLTFTTFWQLGITFTVKDLFPSCVLYYPLLISKEVKDFIIQKVIYLAMLGQMATFYQEPEPHESSDIFMWFSTTSPPAGFTPGLSSTPHTIPVELLVEPSSAGGSQANMSNAPNHILHLNCSALAASSSTRSTTKHSKQKTNEMDDKFFFAGTKEWPAMAIIEPAKLTDDLVAREIGGKFGLVEELRDIFREDGLFKDLDHYKLVPWLGSMTRPNALPLPFTGFPIYLFMTTIVLAGLFDIQNNIYRLPALRGLSQVRHIPMSTWMTGMLLLENSFLKAIGSPINLLANSALCLKRQQHYNNLYKTAVAEDQSVMEVLDGQVFNFLGFQ
ncbi:hypothetical protein L208DRAFT_1380933 [Tricholoma matsutake]|nr:hypothetical protein L208DRAFT_1380933 [Tricholoma matsutake 945]